MRYFGVFTKKEFLGTLRSPKLWITLAVFAWLGILSPVFAKFTPEILGSLLDEQTIIGTGYGSPTAQHSYAQFFKNVGQLGVLLFIVLFGGALTSELSRGTLISGLTRGLPRKTIIFSKLFCGLSVLTAATLLSFALTAAGTALFFGIENIGRVLFAVFCLWLYSALLYCLSFLGGALTGRTVGALLVPGGAFILLSLFSAFPKISRFTPQYLYDSSVGLCSGIVEISQVLPSAAIAAAVCIISVTIAVVKFSKRDM